MRMHKLILCITLAAFADATSAGAPDRADARDDTSYSASLFYRYAFGGSAIAHPHEVGLRLDAANQSLHRTPLLQTRFDGSGYAVVELRGVALPVIPLATSVAETGGFWSSLTLGEYAALGFTAIVVGATVSEATKSNDHTVVSGGS